MTERHLLLDFGSVISVSLFESHADTEAAFGLEPGSLTWRGPIAPETDPLWQKMQRDEITERAYWHQRAAEIGASAGRELGIKDILRQTRMENPDACLRPEMVTLIRAVKAAGRKVGILSNELDLFYGGGFTAKLSLFDTFDSILDASYTKVMKPDARAYQMALLALGVTNSEVLFVDDQQRNIDGARSAGLHAQFFDVANVPGTINLIQERLSLQEPVLAS